MPSRTRLTTDQKMYALALLARGDTLSQTTAAMLERYDLQVSEQNLSMLRKNHKDVITKMQELTAEGQHAEADAILKRTRRMINNKLDRAEKDSRALDELNQQWRDGEITDASEFRRRKAGLLKVSTAELTQISKTMFDQTLKGKAGLPGAPGGELPASTAHGSTPAQLEDMIKAITEGNTVELQRIVFNPGAPAT